MTTYSFNTKPLAVRDTGPAKLPGLSAPPPTGNPALDAWVKQATEHIEVRAGSRGNPYERAVTVREFAAMAKVVEKMEPVVAAVDAILGGAGGDFVFADDAGGFSGDGPVLGFDAATAAADQVAADIVYRA